MKKKLLLIGVPILLVAAVLGTMAMRGGEDETLLVETAKVDIQKIVQKVSADVSAEANVRAAKSNAKLAESRRSRCESPVFV